MAPVSEAPSAPPRQRRRDATRAKVLAVAEPMFARHGYDGTSVRRIAAEAGIGLSLLLYHFGTKEGLYREAYRGFAERRRAAVAAALARTPAADARAVLMILARSWLDIHEGNAARGIGTPFGAFEQNEREAGLVADYLEATSHMLIDALARAVPGAPAAAVHRAYHGFSGALVHFMAQGARIRRLSGGEVADVRASMAALADILAAALAATAPDDGSR